MSLQTSTMHFYIKDPKSHLVWDLEVCSSPFLSTATQPCNATQEPVAALYPPFRIHCSLLGLSLLSIPRCLVITTRSSASSKSTLCCVLCPTYLGDHGSPASPCLTHFISHRISHSIQGAAGNKTVAFFFES